LARLATFTPSAISESGYEQRPALQALGLLAILPAIYRRPLMSKPSQQRAIDSYRSRLSERGLVRFEVIGRDTDRELVRAVARRLAEGGPDADRLRAAVNQAISGEPPRKGGILKALLASPLVGSELDLTRPHEEGRKVDI
jgi:hypothetical protein